MRLFQLFTRRVSAPLPAGRAPRVVAARGTRWAKIALDLAQDAVVIDRTRGGHDHPFGGRNVR